MALPDPPLIVLRQLSDDPEAGGKGGFLGLRRVELVAHFPDGTESAPFFYDMVTRRALDAAIICAHFQREGRHHVLLRSCVRPAAASRPHPPAHDAVLWELPAGLVEPGEPVRTAAARELYEETGARVELSALKELGPWMFPVPAVIGELHSYFHVEIDPDALHPPPGDDSPLEHGALVVALPLDEALALCMAGQIRDLKTELGLRRLRDVLE